METYKTDDISLAAFILASGELLEEVITDAPNHFYFILTNSERCKQLENNFYLNKPIPVQDFISQRERLISTIKTKGNTKL